MPFQLRSSPEAQATALPDHNAGLALGERDPGLRFWRPVLPVYSDIVCAGGAPRQLALRMHESIQIILPRTRFTVFDGTGRSTLMFPGRIHVAAPRVLHGARSLDGSRCDMYMMLLSSETLTKLTEGGPLVIPSNDLAARQHWVVDDPTIHEELSAIVEQVRAPVVATECEHRLAACLAALLALGHDAVRSSRTARSRTRDGLDRVCQHLRANAAVNVSLDELATIAGLSKFYLLRAFRRTYGVTPHGYQMQLRLARAWRLVVDGSGLSWAAYDAGFADQSHLTRRFAALFGVTPGRLAGQLSRRSSRQPIARAEPRRGEITPSAA